MGKYTKFDEHWIDEAIEAQLHVIIKQIRNHFSKIDAIILTGGFARGEGSVLIKENNQIIPLKDYDLVVITNERISSQKYYQLMDIIHEDLQIPSHWYGGSAPGDFHINIEFIPAQKINRLPPDLSNYELKVNGKTLYGKNYLNSIKIQPNQISLASGIRFLCNKLIGLLENHPWNSNVTPETKKGQALLYECAKTYIEICTALSLAGRFYAPTYQERAILFEKKYSRLMPELQLLMPYLPERIKNSTQYKLKPESNPFGKNLTEVWMNTKNDLLTVLTSFLQSSKTSSPMKLFDFLRLNYYTDYLSFYLKKTLLSNHVIRVFLALILQFAENLKYQLQSHKFGKSFSLLSLLRCSSPMFYVYSAAYWLMVGMIPSDDGKKFTIQVKSLDLIRNYLKHVAHLQSPQQNESVEWLNLSKACVAAQKALVMEKRSKMVL